MNNNPYKKTGLILKAALCSGLLLAGYQTAYAVPQSAARQVSAGTMSGTVVDAATGEPLIGASVRSSDGSATGVTDLDGNFTIKLSKPATIEITYVGYQPLKVKVNPGESKEFQMQENSQLLDEVVVVGFGTQKKVNLTGAVGVATGKEIAERPVQSTAAALQGVIPGLNITNSASGGELNATKQVGIRGMNTIGEGSLGGPLILIDGMEGDMNTINPADIQSISVLKDAAASSIYGSRAPFGVILITTKTGAKGKAQIHYNNSFRWNQPLTPMQMMDSWEYISYLNDVQMYTSNKPEFDADFTEQAYLYYTGQIDNPFYENKWDGTHRRWGTGECGGTFANINWRDELYKKTAFAQEHNVTLQGGSEKIQYYVSGQYLGQGGFLKYGNDNYERFNVTGKFNAQMFSWLRLNFSSRWVRTQYSRPTIMSGGFYEKVIRRLPPTNPKYDPNGYIAADYNYIEHLENGGRHKEMNDIFTNQIQLVATPLKGWNITTELNARLNNDWTHQDTKPVYAHDADDLEGLSHESTHLAFDSGEHSSVSEYAYRSTYLNWNIYSDYNFTIADKNEFKVMLGFQTEAQNYRNLSAYRDDMVVEDIPVIKRTSSTDTWGIDGEVQKWRTAGFFGRINYNFDGRYLFEANLRYDASSRFRKEHRWVWSPSFSAGWNVANEKFWEPIASWWNQLKIRASWGQLSNQNTKGWYPTYRVLDVKNNNSSWLVNGLKPATAAFPALINPLLTWEKIQTTNIGIDFGFFQNRLNGSFDYFWRTNRDMIGDPRVLPAILGADVPQENRLKMRTYGWELMLQWQDNIKDFNYSVKFNISDDQTKIIEYANDENYIDKRIAGRMAGEIYGLTTIGVARDDQEMADHLATLPNGGQDAIGSNWQGGDIMYKDINGDGKITKGTTIDDLGDLKVIGNDTPRYQFGLNLYGEWKGIDLTLFFQGVAKRDYYFSPYGGQGTGGKSAVFWGATTGGRWESIFLKEHLDYWRDENSALGENRDSYYGRPLYYTNKNREAQTRFLQDASYIRLKNLQIGYTLPQKWTRKAYIEKLRLYFSAENLFTCTKMSKVIDPESLEVSSMKSGSSYPIAKTYSFGLSIDF